mgnify:CR=1 FL=1
MDDVFGKELTVGDVVLYSQVTPNHGMTYSIGEIFKISIEKKSKTGWGNKIPPKASIRITKSSDEIKNGKSMSVLASKVLLLKSNQKETS